jgi:hypothetical protein
MARPHPPSPGSHLAELESQLVSNRVAVVLAACERLSAVDMRKEPVTDKAGRREPHNAADSRKNLGHGSILLWFRMLPTYSGAGNDLSGLK